MFGLQCPFVLQKQFKQETAKLRAQRIIKPGRVIKASPVLWQRNEDASDEETLLYRLHGAKVFRQN